MDVQLWRHIISENKPFPSFDYELFFLDFLNFRVMFQWGVP